MIESEPADNPGAVPEVSPSAAANGAAAFDAAQQRGFRHGWISVLLLLQLVAIVCWAWPFNVPVIQDVKELARPYLIWSGLFQSWDFFAPNPKPTNSYVEAVIITRDRHQLVWTFPAMERLGYFDRYREERYRKFTEALPDPVHAPLWPGIARHIAEKFANPADPPQVVLLVSVSAPIAPGVNRAPTPRVFYEYEVALPDGDTP